MKVTFTIKKSAKRYDTALTATTYLRLRIADNWRYPMEHPMQVTGDILFWDDDIGYWGDYNYINHPFWD